MTKSELITRIAASYPHLQKIHAERVVGAIFEKISEALRRGERVELRNFGAFTVSKLKPRTGRNPRTGESIFLREKHLPRFRASKGLKHRLNHND